MAKKPPKKCKQCSSPILNTLTIKAIGAKNFCSLSCFYKSAYSYKQPSKSMSKRLATQLDLTLPTYVDKKVQQIDFKPQIGPILKDIPDRNPAYLTFIRSFPCLVCNKTGQDIHAHHIESGGIGVKCSDFLTVSLCHNHHEGGNESVHHLGATKFQELHKVDFTKATRDYLIRYIRKNDV